MSGTEARTTDGGTTGANGIRHNAGTAAERLGGPLAGEQSRDAASEAGTDVGRGADSTAGEGERSPDAAAEAKTNAVRQAETGVRQRTALIEAERAESYNSRWKELKGEFVDDPRRAVRGATELVGEVLDELEELLLLGLVLVLELAAALMLRPGATVGGSVGGRGAARRLPHSSA